MEAHTRDYLLQEPSTLIQGGSWGASMVRLEHAILQDMELDNTRKAGFEGLVDASSTTRSFRRRGSKSAPFENRLQEPSIWAHDMVHLEQDILQDNIQKARGGLVDADSEPRRSTSVLIRLRRHLKHQMQEEHHLRYLYNRAAKLMKGFRTGRLQEISALAGIQRHKMVQVGKSQQLGFSGGGSAPPRDSELDDLLAEVDNFDAEGEKPMGGETRDQFDNECIPPMAIIRGRCSRDPSKDDVPAAIAYSCEHDPGGITCMKWKLKQHDRKSTLSFLLSSMCWV